MREYIGILIICIFILLVIMLIAGDYHTNLIKQTVTENGGDYISSEGIVFGSPFILRAKGDRIYKFNYYYEGKERVGFVKFGLATEWIFDYQEK